MSNRYPLNYCKLYKPQKNDPFCSAFLTHQSQITDKELGVHITACSTQFSDRFNHVNTLYDVFQQGLDTSKYLPCLGGRSTTTKPYEWLVYQEVYENIRRFGSAMLETVGFRENENNFVGIYSRNSPAWVTTQFACAAYSYVYVPFYDTLGETAMQHILNQTQLRMILCNTVKEANLILRKMNAPHIEYMVIVTEDETISSLEREFHGKIKILKYDEFISLGKANLKPLRLPKPSQLCTLCYTSGTTGIPKGVMLRHMQYADAVKAMVNTTEGKFNNPLTTHLSYLPLAHVLEQLLFMFALLNGARAAFLTKGPETMLADLRDVRPTIFGAVPRVLSKFRSEFYKKLPKYGCLRRMIEKTIEDKNKHQAKGKFKPGGFVDHFIFAKMRNLFGGRVCGFVSGGAPLIPEVSKFYRAVFNCPVVEGYGSTETLGALTITLLGEPECGVAGAPTTGVEIRLDDVPEMGVVALRDGIGEICARGLRVTDGYYKDPENTEKLFTSDGWVRLGDLGKWNKNGTLVVVDRCKNMFKLSQGEYIAPEKVEGVYQCCPLCMYVLVDGDSTKQYAVAVVHPDFAMLRAQLTQSSATLSDLVKLSDEELCGKMDVRKFVLNRMNTVASGGGLKKFEQVYSLHLTPDPFTIANGLLTPTLKTSRYKAREVYKEKIRAMYAEGPILSI